MNLLEGQQGLREPKGGKGSWASKELEPEKIENDPAVSPCVSLRLHDISFCLFANWLPLLRGHMDVPSPGFTVLSTSNITQRLAS